MNWVPAQRTNYQQRLLVQRVHTFTHAVYGTLTITRQQKTQNNQTITFRLRLVPPNNQPPLENSCQIIVTNDDTDALRPGSTLGVGGGIGTHRLPQGQRQLIGGVTFGYSMIDISTPVDLSGRKIIYLIHHVAAQACIDLGIATFIVTNIVNPGLIQVCLSCGMRDAIYPNSYQGSAVQVANQGRQRALGDGWN